MNIFTDGKNTKSIQSLLNVPEAWTWISGGPKATDGMKLLQQEVPWLYRGLQIRMNSVASVPFNLYKGEEVYDSSEDWQNKVGFWPNPRQTIMKAEGALTLFGKSYFFKNPSVGNKPLEFRYWFPLSVKAVIDKDLGFIGFERKIPGKEEPDKYEVEDILYIWGVDPYVEIGPPLSSPATAALAAAGVMWNVNEFAAAYFERGAVKATILSVPQGTLPQEKQRLETWYNKAINGIKAAWSTKVLNADAVTATVIGEGIKELQNIELTNDNRKDIASALGIPQSKMDSVSSTDSNRIEDEMTMINDMTTPDCRLIEEAMNEQVWEGMGLRMRFHPESMSMFQEDEQDRSAAFLNYVSATGKDKASIWAGFLGIEFQEAELEDIDSEPMEMMNPQEMKEETKNPQKEEERKQFYRWAKKRAPKEWHKFKFNHLDEMEQLDLIDVPQRDDSELVKSLTNILDELRNDREPMTLNMPPITVNLPEGKVYVENQVDVPGTEVKNEIILPEQKAQEIPAPNVTVNVEPTPVEIKNDVDVYVPEPKPKKTKVKRNSRGEITEMETE